MSHNGQAVHGNLAPRPHFTFDVDPSLEEWKATADRWLSQHAQDQSLRQSSKDSSSSSSDHTDVKLDGLATGNIIFNNAGRILLIQRASHDSMPDRWEIPGGAVDDDDPSILFGAAREVWEESGLMATRFRSLVTAYPTTEEDEDTRSHSNNKETTFDVFQNSRKTKWICRFTFLVEVADCEEVRLDPNEHQDFLWAEEEEIREQRRGNRALTITHPYLSKLMLEGFRVMREDVPR